jgi:spore coat protein H
MTISRLLVIAVLVWVSVHVAGESQTPPGTSAQMFETAKVWTIHLKFAPEEWKAMEPARGGGMFGPPQPPGPGGAVAAPAGPPRGFGPSMFLAPVFLRDGDLNHDGKLSREEFMGLGRKWFGGWDKASAGHINNDQLRDGLNATFAPPQGMGPPPGMENGPERSMFQGREGQRNGLASMMGIEFKFVHADLEFAGETIKDVGVRYKGNGTWMQSQGSMKRSMKVDLDHFVKGRHLAGVSKFNLHSCVTDASFMNEVLAYRLYRDAGVPAPRTAYARVYVTVPGQYERKFVGLYSLVENVDTTFIHERFGVQKGVLFKPVAPSLFSDLGDDWAKYKQAYDPKSKPSEHQTRRLIEFARLVSKADDVEFSAKAGDYLDLEEFARYMATTTWLSTLDGILATGQNYYVYLNPRTDKFQFIPWDLDHSFGQFYPMGTQEQREDLSILQPWAGNNRFLERIFKLDGFKQLYLARLREFSGTIFKPDRFHAQVDELGKVIRPAVGEESKEKLARFDKVVAGEPVAATGGPGPFATPTVKPIKGFVDARAKSVVAQLGGEREGARVGGFGFGPPPPGAGGPNAARPPAQGDFGPGRFLAPALMAAHDTNKDGQLGRDEFLDSFGKWFEAWNTDHSGTLSDEQLRGGIDKALAPRQPGGQGPQPAPPR